MLQVNNANYAIGYIVLDISDELPGYCVDMVL